MSELDAPEVAAAIAARKKALDLQAVMAVLGMGAVAAVFTVDLADYAKTVAALKTVFPWCLGLSILIVAANRATLRLQSKAIRRHAGAGR